MAAELRPHAMEWEDAEWFPNEVFARMAEVGFLGLKYPEELGGEGGDYLHDAVLSEELSLCGSGGVAAGHRRAHRDRHAAGVEVRHRGAEAALPGARDQGEQIAALGITEPEAGSDVAGIRTNAERVDGGWLVNGSKTFITNGVRARLRGHRGQDHAARAATTACRSWCRARVRGLRGLQEAREARLARLGHGELVFDDVFVPEENLLGEENDGFYLIMANFQWERLLMALGAVGSMQAVIDLTIDYARERNGLRPAARPVPGVRHKLAEMAPEPRDRRASPTTRCACSSPARTRRSEVTMAKLVTQRAASTSRTTRLQIHGGAGYMRSTRSSAWRATRAWARSAAAPTRS